MTAFQFPDVRLRKLNAYHDSRGYFLETYRQAQACWHTGTVLPDAKSSKAVATETTKRAANTAVVFVQDNLSKSKQGVLRGLHYQQKNPQGKLVQVLDGNIYDVVVDVRCQSPTFGRWQGFQLSSQQPQQLWVPPGFAHGFLVLSKSALVLYKCTAYYHADDEVCLAWNDPDVGISWPTSRPTLSHKDQQALSLQSIKAQQRCIAC